MEERGGLISEEVWEKKMGEKMKKRNEKWRKG